MLMWLQNTEACMGIFYWVSNSRLYTIAPLYCNCVHTNKPFCSYIQLFSSNLINHMYQNTGKQKTKQNSKYCFPSFTWWWISLLVPRCVLIHLNGPEETAIEGCFKRLFVGSYLQFELEIQRGSLWCGGTKHCHSATWTRRSKRVGPSFTRGNKLLRAKAIFYAPNSKQTPGLV